MDSLKQINEIHSALEILMIKTIALKEELSGGSGSSIKKRSIKKGVVERRRNRLKKNKS